MDFFDILLAKKLEDDRDPTIEGLSVTENGIYSEENKAYNPVIVEVPEPTLITKSITANGTYSASDDNADGYSSVTVAVEGFKKKSIANTPTDIASFNDGTANPMPSLEISIEPVQSGSGDPSPSNVRPISGWSGANVTVVDDLITPTETHTLSIPFHDNSDNPITVYGGTLNVTSGELRVDRANVTLNGSENWLLFQNVGINQLYIDLNNISPSYDVITTICDRYKSILIGGRNNNYNSCYAGANGLCFNIENTTVDEWKASLQANNTQVVYKFETPQTYQLTPTQVTTLLGQNNIFADCGQILEGEYFVTL